MLEKNDQYENQKLTDGGSFYCPFCRTRSIVRKKHEYEGFAVKRTYFCCAFCGNEIREPSAPAAAGTARSSSLTALDSLFADSSASETTEHSGNSALDDLFGGAPSSPSSSAALAEALPSPSASAHEKQAQPSEIYHFCRNCLHHFENPFRVHCVLHDRDVDPMEDCPDFAPLHQKNDF